MALKALMLRTKINKKNTELDELRSKSADFEKREKELEEAIAEAETEEEQAAVEAEVEKFENEKADHEKNISDLEKEVGDLEAELIEEEKRSNVPPVDKKETEPQPKEERAMAVRSKFFGMTIQERDAFLARDEVKTFLNTAREAISGRRAISNVGLTIPEVMLDLLKQVAEEKSKLLGKVSVKPVSGTARQVIMGTIPEGIWTEMCATLNELDFGFNDVEVDGYKVGGYFAICNAVIEDNDVNLASEIVTALGTAIAKALDRAILYGTGTKMPLGIATRLAQTAKPSGYPATARDWTDLHETNVITGSGKTGVSLFKEIILNQKAIVNDYFDGDITFVMNRKTYLTLLAESMDKNMNAALVAGINNSMPIVGGEIIQCNIVPEGDVICGYFDAYILAERSGSKIEQSKEAKFIQDQTVFKGTARYDGVPAIAEAFEIFSIGTTAPATTSTFPTDKANS